MKSLPLMGLELNTSSHGGFDGVMMRSASNCSVVISVRMECFNRKVIPENTVLLLCRHRQVVVGANNFQY